MIFAAGVVVGYLLVGMCLFGWPYDGWRGVRNAVANVLVFVMFSACWLPIIVLDILEDWERP